MPKRYATLFLTVLVCASLFSSMAMASPIDDFFNWIKSLFGMQYSVSIIGEPCLQNSDCLTGICNNPLSNLNTGTPTSFVGSGATVSCPSNINKCVVNINCKIGYYAGGISSSCPSISNPYTLKTLESVSFKCCKPLSATTGTYTVQYYGICQGQSCGNGYIEGSEICDSNYRFQTISTTQGGCQGTIQQKQTCLTDCSGWGSWTDVSGTFVKTDKCCGVSCSPTTAQCNSFCSGNQYCSYSSSVASCTPTCNNGICVSCSPTCGTPSCVLTKGECGVACQYSSDCIVLTKKCPEYCSGVTYYPSATDANCQQSCINGACQDCTPICQYGSGSITKGKCGASCSSNSDCTAKTVSCPEKCDGRKYIASVASQSCYPTCANGQCTDCTAICPYASGSYVVGKCGANCVANQNCGNCGINKCVDGILQGCEPVQNKCGSGYECK